MAWLSPNEDHTFYRETNESQPAHQSTAVNGSATAGRMTELFNSGSRKLETEKREEAQRKHKMVVIKYSAPQVLGSKSQEAKAIKMGSKLVGFLVNAIDTRSPSLVRVRLPHGGESAGIEIEAGSILTGQFSFAGSDDKIFISFSRLDSPEGEARPIHALALDSATYTSGIQGEVYSSAGVKVAAQLGLSMFSGMADVLTEKESLGTAVNGVQAKPTMKNALLQGTSRAAQDQSSRTASQIDSAKDYMILPAGKEMIIELTEDYRK